MADLLGAAEALWSQLEQRLPGFEAEVLPQVDSTSTRLIEQTRRGICTPALLVALEQTAGRGRQGRSWLAKPGEALTFSLRLPLPAEMPLAQLSGLSPALGVAAAEALGPAVQVKWPNDLCLIRPGTGGVQLGKLGGMLIETAAAADGGPEGTRGVIVGLGINLSGETPAVLATQGAQAGAPAPLPWASLAQAGARLTPALALRQVVPALVDAWLRFRGEGLQPFLPRYAARDALAGHPVRSWNAAAAQAEDGVAQGLDLQGRLLVHTARGLQALASGEVSVRPAIPPA